jgi:hypothetical protein
MAARKIISFLCLVGLLSSLAACAGGSTSATSTTATAAPAAAPAPAAEPAKPAPKRLTAREINEACWLSPEINKVPDLDKRAKLVDKCVDARTKAQQGM